MEPKITKPTHEFYGQLQQAYDWFNRELFNNALPSCLITVQRERNTMGYFSPLRWSHGGKKDVHEIALNPAYFANKKVIEIFQTLVHEQCHLWQHEFGSPSRGGYHNQEWANKMESFGLMPSSTGTPGGKKTGQSMSDYVIETGRFKQTCIELIQSGHEFRWADRRISKPSINNLFDFSSLRDLLDPCQPTLSQTLPPSPEKILNISVSTLIPNFAYHDIQHQLNKLKTKYSCPICKTNVWGRANLRIRCEECSELFIAN
jgi:predicted SprT family Zn-dependent metalloprotease